MTFLFHEVFFICLSYDRSAPSDDFFEAAQTYMLDICTFLRTQGPQSEANLLKNVKVPKRLGVKRFLQQGVLLNFCKQRRQVFCISEDNMISYKQQANSKWQISDHQRNTAYVPHDHDGFANRHQPQSGWEWE